MLQSIHFDLIKLDMRFMQQFDRGDEGRIILTIQIWEVLLIGICAGAKALRWLLKKKRMERADTKAEKERSTQDGELEYRESDGHHDAEDP